MLLLLDASASSAARTAAVDGVGAAEAAFMLIMPLMVEGATAPP
jgi:ornithine cyclodeaminase/alanine dehydrogenase-like protein (mu-crystallin family)